MMGPSEYTKHPFYRNVSLKMTKVKESAAGKDDASLEAMIESAELGDQKPIASNESAKKAVAPRKTKAKTTEDAPEPSPGSATEPFGPGSLVCLKSSTTIPMVVATKEDKKGEVRCYYTADQKIEQIELPVCVLNTYKRQAKPPRNDRNNRNDRNFRNDRNDRNDRNFRPDRQRDSRPSRFNDNRFTDDRKKNFRGRND